MRHQAIVIPEFVDGENCMDCIAEGCSVEDCVALEKFPLQVTFPSGASTSIEPSSLKRNE